MFRYRNSKKEDKMYKKILVPLDGSELAECVLPHVGFIAKSCSAGNIVLVRAFEPYVPSAAQVYLTEEQRKEADEKAKQVAREYLDQVASRVKINGVKVQTQLITGRAAESIAEYATENDVDLIIIATHGRSGISRWVWGSVADRILRSASVPVLMVRAPGYVPGT
jgi:nucleotide-binding universal stress UspA family protein